MSHVLCSKMSGVHLTLSLLSIYLNCAQALISMSHADSYELSYEEQSWLRARTAYLSCQLQLLEFLSHQACCLLPTAPNACIIKSKLTSCPQKIMHIDHWQLVHCGIAYNGTLTIVTAHINMRAECAMEQCQLGSPSGIQYDPVQQQHGLGSPRV